MTTTKSDPIDVTLENLPTKSARIRFLASEGMARADIARKLGLRYQHIRNVLITPLKRDL